MHFVDVADGAVAPTRCPAAGCVVDLREARPLRKITRMERRKDLRHGFRCVVTLRCLRSRRVLAGFKAEDVSASGLRVRSSAPHTLAPGDRLEVQLVGYASEAAGGEALVFATAGMVVRSEDHIAALRFDAPLSL